MTKIGTWNVRTLNDPSTAATGSQEMTNTSRLLQVCQEMSRYGLEILGLSETKWMGNGEFVSQTGHHLIFSGSNTGHERGVGILMSPKAKRSLLEYRQISERIILARFRSKLRNIVVIQCYAPTDDMRYAEQKDLFYHQLEDTITTCRRGDIKIVMGDFNAKVGTDNQGFEEVMGRNGLAHRGSDNGDRLKNLCSSYRLVIGGTKFSHLDIHKYTWQSPDGVTRNQIDHIMISKRFAGSLLDVRTKRGADAFSDHNLLIGSFRLRPAALHPQQSATRKYNLQGFKDPAKVEEYRLCLDNKLSQVNEEISWSIVESACKSSAEETLGFVQHQRKSWMSNATWKHIEERRALKVRLDQSRSQDNSNQLRADYKRAEKRVRSSVRSDRRRFANNIAEEAERAAYRNDMRGVYSSIRKLGGEGVRPIPPLKDRNGIVLVSEQQQLDRWKEFFDDPGPTGDSPPFAPQVRRNPRRDINTEPPNRVEIEAVIVQLKNHKATGPDSLPAELFKYGSSPLANALTPIIREVWSTCCIPDIWKEGVIITIPKKGDLGDCKNWRGITLLNTIEKVLAFIILGRILPSVDILLRQEQAGFRKGRSCVDHINTLRLIIEQSVEMNSPLYLLFVDFERAFDTIHRTAIWSALQNLGIPETIVNLIKELYRDAACSVRYKGKHSAKFNISRGVRQGCVLSPLLFLVVLDSVLVQTNIQAPNGIQWRPFQKLNDLDYADDICMMTHRLPDMENKLRSLIVNAAKVGLRVNFGKTKVMRIKTNCSDPLTATIDDNLVTIEDVEIFSYLGSVITKTGGADLDIQSRINKARYAFRSLEKVWRSNIISRRTKIRIFNSSVKSVLLYGSETWRVTDILSNKLRVFTNKCLRRICRIFYPDTISNARLHSLTGSEPVDIEIRRRKWRWIGHTLRKPDNDIAKMSFEWNPQGRRNVGRPVENWRRSVQREIVVGRSWREIKRLAQDRRGWREFVSALCSQ